MQNQQRFNPPVVKGVRTTTAPIRCITVQRPQSMAVAGVYTPQTCVTVIDISISMEAERKLFFAWTASLGLFEELSHPTSADSFTCGMVVYSASARVLQALAPVTEVLSRLKGMSMPELGDATNIAAGLQSAGDLLWNTQHPATVIVMSDGQHNMDGYDPLSVASTLKSQFLIVTVGFGSDADEDTLRQIASGPEYYFKAATGAQLKSLFKRVGHTLSVSVRTGTNPHAALRNI